MKNIFILFIAIAGLFVACDKDDVSPEITFEYGDYILDFDDTLEVVAVLNVAPLDDMEVSFTVDGDAIEGEEFTISDKKFVFKKGEKKSVVKLVHRKSYKSLNNIILNIEQLSDYKFGNYKTTFISVEQSKKIKYSFIQKKYDLARTVEVEMEIKDKLGHSLGNKEDIHIPFKFDEESAAKEGVNFVVLGMEDGKKEFVFPAGKYKAKIKLKVIEFSDTDNSFKIIPDVGGEGYMGGRYKYCNISIVPNISQRMVGKWVGSSFDTEDYLKDMVQWSAPHDADNLPKNISLDDKLEFVFAGKDKLKLNVDLKGDLKDYLRNCDMQFTEDVKTNYEGTGGGMAPPDMYTCEQHSMSVANIAFASDVINEREVKISFNIRMVGGKEVLDMIIYQYAPEHFLIESLKYCIKYNGGPFIDDYYQLRYTFVRPE